MLKPWIGSNGAPKLFGRLFKMFKLDELGCVCAHVTGGYVWRIWCMLLHAKETNLLLLPTGIGCIGVEEILDPTKVHEDCTVGLEEESRYASENVIPRSGDGAAVEAAEVDQAVEQEGKEELERGVYLRATKSRCQLTANCPCPTGQPSRVLSRSSEVDGPCDARILHESLGGGDWRTLSTRRPYPRRKSNEF